MYRTEEGEEEEEAEFVSEETEGVNGLRVELHADFQVRVRQLQAEARRGGEVVGANLSQAAHGGDEIRGGGGL